MTDNFQERFSLAWDASIERFARKPLKSSPGQSSLFDESAHPRWQAGDKQHHGGQFAPKEQSQQSVKTLKEAVESGMSPAEWEHHVSTAFRTEQIDDKHPAWQALNNPGFRASFDGQKLVGRKVTSVINGNRLTGTAERATVGPDGNPGIVVKMDDGRTGIWSTHNTDDLEAFQEHEKKRKNTPVKEPWQMTRNQFVNHLRSLDPSESNQLHASLRGAMFHRTQLQKAIAEGKPIPPEVLADYPDLQKPQGSADALAEYASAVKDHKGDSEGQRRLWEATKKVQEYLQATGYDVDGLKRDYKNARGATARRSVINAAWKQLGKKVSGMALEDIAIGKPYEGVEQAREAEQAKIAGGGGQPKPVTDLFGNKIAPAHKTATFVTNKGKQQEMFAGLNSKPGQMNLFADNGVPDDMVNKEIKKDLFAVRHAPEGGIVLAGVKFTGGEFIPDYAWSAASSHEKAAYDHAHGKLAGIHQKSIFGEKLPPTVLSDRHKEQAAKAQAKAQADVPQQSKPNSPRLFDSFEQGFLQAWEDGMRRNVQPSTGEQRTLFAAVADVERFARIKSSAGQKMMMFDEAPKDPSPVHSKWDESKHPREETTHDGKRPGEFAPSSAPKASPVEDPGKAEDPIDDGEPFTLSSTPREVAAKNTAKMVESDYKYARVSAIKNAGEDLWGSARHRANAWRGLDEAEADGSAAKMVTRDMLLRNEPHGLMSVLDSKPGQALSVLAAHFAIKALPPKPTREAASARKKYVDFFRKFKAKAEELAQSESDPQNVLHGLLETVQSEMKANYGDEDRMATLLHPMQKQLLTSWRASKSSAWEKLKEFTGYLQRSGASVPSAETAKEEKEKWFRDVLGKRVASVLDGDSIPAAFGIEAGQTKKKGIKTSDCYTGQAIRQGGKDVTSMAGSSDANALTNHLVKSLGMRGVQWGNYVTDKERPHHAKQALEAMVDLCDVLGLPMEQASLKGRIGLAIGARGHSAALAHYEPSTKVINLTKSRGAGALAHEWGHAFDHMLHGEDKYLSDVPEHEHTWNPETKKYEQKSRTNDPVFAAMAGVKKSWKDSGFSGQLSTELNRAVKEGVLTRGSGGGMSGSKTGYWSSHLEMFARTFERYIQHKLSAQNRKNTYLSGVDTSNHKYKLWPTDEQVEKMAPAFDQLIDAYRRHRLGLDEPVKYSQRDRELAVELMLDNLDLPDRFSILWDRYALKKKSSPGQKTFWDESQHPRESESHDTKRPGEFAPKKQFSPFGKREAVNVQGLIKGDAPNPKRHKIIGQTIGSPEDLAKLAQAYRDPRYETFRAIFVKNGKVVGVNAYTSRHVSAVRFHPDEFIPEIAKDHMAIGADSVYLCHNHPSGDPTPSSYDYRFTQGAAEMLQKGGVNLVGHIIVDHTKATWIDAKAMLGNNNGDVDRIKAMMGHNYGDVDRIIDVKNESLFKTEVPHDLLESHINSQEAFVAAILKARVEKGRVTVVGTDVRGKVKAIFDVSSDAMMKPAGNIHGALRRLGRNLGVANFFGAAKESDKTALQHARKHGVFMDSVLLGENNEYMGVDPNAGFAVKKPPKIARKIPERFEWVRRSSKSGRTAWKDTSNHEIRYQETKPGTGHDRQTAIHVSQVKPGHSLRFLANHGQFRPGHMTEFVGAGSRPGTVRVKSGGIEHEVPTHAVGAKMTSTPKKTSLDRGAKASPAIHQISAWDFANKRHGLLVKNNNDGKAYLYHGGQLHALTDREYDGKSLLASPIKIRERIHREAVASHVSKGGQVPEEVRSHYGSNLAKMVASHRAATATAATKTTTKTDTFQGVSQDPVAKPATSQQQNLPDGSFVRDGKELMIWHGGKAHPLNPEEKRNRPDGEWPTRLPKQIIERIKRESPSPAPVAPEAPEAPAPSPSQDGFETHPLSDHTFGRGVKIKQEQGTGDYVRFASYHDKDGATIQGPSVNVPKDEADQFANDLKGKISGTPNHEDERVNSVLRGEGQFLGRGNDGLVFGTGDSVVKATSSVPYHWHAGHRPHFDEVQRAEKVSRIANELIGNGVSGIAPHTFHHHEGRGYTVMPKLEVPEAAAPRTLQQKATPEQLEKIRSTLDQIHSHGYSVGDEIQFGVTPNGDPQMFDLGAISKDGPERDREAFRRLQKANGQEPYQWPDEIEAEKSLQQELENMALKQSARKHGAPKEESAYVPLADTLDHGYKRGESSRTTPARMKQHPIGTWRIDDMHTMRGRHIEQLRMVPVDDLEMPEGDYSKTNQWGGYENNEGRGDDARRYAEWIRSQGIDKVPPVSVLETEDGKLRLSDGHRRTSAAKLAGHTHVPAWVSPIMDTGIKDSNGKPILSGLTYEATVHGPHKAYEMWEARNKAALERRPDQLEVPEVPKESENVPEQSENVSQKSENVSQQSPSVLAGKQLHPDATEPLRALGAGRYSQKVGAAQVHYSNLHRDPARFQYKISGIGEKGVNKELADVKKFNPVLGGQVLAWFDPDDNKSYVVNGHHRHELAERSGAHDQWDGNMQVYYVDAKNAQEARAIGALANIAEGRGTAVDAAKFMRDSGHSLEDMANEGVSVKGQVAERGSHLAKLSDGLFDRVATGAMDEGRGVAIAKHLGGNVEAQNDLLNVIRSHEDKRGALTDSQVEEMAKELLASTVQAKQGSLFGDDTFSRSTMGERAMIKSFIRQQLAGERRDFAAASTTRRKDALEGAGSNKIDVETNKTRAATLATLIEHFDKAANWSGHGIATTISRAAERLADEPRSRKDIEKQTLERVRDLLSAELEPEQPPKTMDSQTGGLFAEDGGDGPSSGRFALARWDDTDTIRFHLIWGRHVRANN